MYKGVCIWLPNHCLWCVNCYECSKPLLCPSYDLATKGHCRQCLKSILTHNTNSSFIFRWRGFILSLMVPCNMLITTKISIYQHDFGIKGQCNMLNSCLGHVIGKIVSEYDQKNTTITNCRQPRGTARKSRSTITRHKEDKLSKAISSLFPIKMIAILEWT